MERRYSPADYHTTTNVMADDSVACVLILILSAWLGFGFYLMTQPQLRAEIRGEIRKGISALVR